MISPYLRRPLRSLDEILTQDGENAAAGRARAPKLPLPKPTPGASARSIDSTTDPEKSIASNP